VDTAPADAAQTGDAALPRPTLDAPPPLAPPDLALLGQRWERHRLAWLTSGGADGGGVVVPAPGADVAAMAARLLALRRSRKRRNVRVNAKSILSVRGTQ
jgi:hypothetical protein